MGRPAWDATGCCVGGGMMKRNILKKLTKINKKFVLCLMLAGFAAINSGFTDKTEPPTPAIEENIQVEDTSSNEPTTISVSEDGKIKVSEQDDLTLALARVVEDTVDQAAESSTSGKTLKEAVDETMQTVEVSAIKELQPIVEPVPIVKPVPENVIDTPDGYMPYTQVFDMEATAYLPTDGSAEGLTAMGIPATYGVVAVDPDVIPLGTKVYIPGYGVALAADTGGAIYGYKIDLCMESYDEAMDFGRRYVTVFVLE